MTKITFLLLGIFLVQCCESPNRGLRAHNDAQTVPNRTISASDDMKLIGSEVDISISTQQLQIVDSILTSFKNDKEIPLSKKDLSNYRLEIRRDITSENELIIGNLIVKRDPGKIYVGGETEFGIDVVYLISQKDFVVIQRAFPK